MIHEELKLRVTADTSPAMFELNRLAQAIEENPALEGRIVVEVRVDTEDASTKIRSMAVALTAANQQIQRLEERLGLVEERTAKAKKKAPKRPALSEL